MKTFSAKAEEVRHDWLLVDAEGQTLGRLASKIASVLRGKHKPEYTPHTDVGDYVVVVNAEKIAVTGKKLTDKMYYRHSGRVGHLKTTSLEDLLAKKPEDVLRLAVKGMMPRGPLGRAMQTKLKVYAGTEHPHTAQQPNAVEL